MNIEPHIKWLVIDEALTGDEGMGNVRAAIEHELMRRLMQPGTAESLHHLGAVSALPSAPLLREPLGARIASAAQPRLGFNITVHDRGASRHD